MISRDPSPSNNRAYKQEEEEWSEEGINTQEPGQPHLGDQLWEYKSLVHWALVTNRTEHQES